MLRPGPVLIAGAGGQIGRALQAAVWPRGFRPLPLDHRQLEIADPDAVRAALTKSGAVALINAAAFTAVDRAESEPEAAWRSNGEAPGVLAAECARRALPLLHLSTDFVFSGDGGAPYREDAATGPLGVYGASKLAGEQRVRDANAEHLILRTAWVFDAIGRNFLTTILSRARAGEEVRVVADQRGMPTAAGDIAAVLLAMLAARAAGQGAWGTFHFAGAGETSWHGFAEAIVEQALSPADRPRVMAIATADWPTPARRPADSRLDCAKLAAVYGLRARPWRTMLAEVLAAVPAAAA